MSLNSMSAARCFSSSASQQPRSVYVARLRRAFLLRVHPDRFRSSSPDIRRRQADLVHAMSERMAFPDFLAYTCDQGIDVNSLSHRPPEGTYKYVLEHKDGSILQHTIRLHDSVESVLKNMVAALESTGSASMPPPPGTPSPPEVPTHNGEEIFWCPRQPRNAGGVNHQYDVNTHKGRDLMGFLRTMDFDLIEKRRASRMDVTAVALVARRAFSFLSIDGTGLGWSSASFAILLRSLVALQEEHGTKFHVKSFYPLQLVWSSEEFEDPIDLYGGILYLNPASTPIQWLDSFLKITQGTLDALTANQAQLHENRSKVLGAFGGVKFQKGHSCSHRDFHLFLSRLAESHHVIADERQSTALTLEGIIVAVEAACRRPFLTKEGVIRVGASMDGEFIARAIAKHSLEATERVKAEGRRRQRCRETIDRAQWELGLQKVYHTRLVRSEQIVECLARLLAMKQREQLKQNLAGNSLGIAGSGHFCHVGDDGSVVIPWDWR